ncbi:MAG: hypothetical protein Q8O30_12575 [Candidatus Omnitrophota bacterium]|nr:hypothetical protein [Candidatus Omnitrophota bacterium]
MDWENQLMCPYCEASYRYRDLDQKGKWDFIDGERHRVTCKSCKKDFVVGIDRSIEVWIEEIEKRRENEKTQI